MHEENFTGFMQVTDSTIEMIKEREISLNLERIIVVSKPVMKIELNHWEKAGLRINISVEGIGYGYFNDIPYKDRKTALREYKSLLTNLSSGNYVLELHGNGKIKLKFD